MPAAVAHKVQRGTLVAKVPRVILVAKVPRVILVAKEWPGRTQSHRFR